MGQFDIRALHAFFPLNSRYSRQTIVHETMIIALKPTVPVAKAHYIKIPQGIETVISRQQHQSIVII
jgi:hypothetical protein